MKTVFITGAASGIGLATAQHFASKGYFVGLYDISREPLEALLGSGDFPNACGNYCDVTDADSIASALTHFSSHCQGRMDVLVNNAGVLTSGHFEEISTRAHDLMIDVNIRGLTQVAHAAFPLLKETAGSTLVNLCSVSSLHGMPLLAVYSATKFYVNGLTEALNLEWAEHDIRVTSVKPPAVNTAMGHKLEPSLTRKMSIDMEPKQIAEAIIKAAEGTRTSYVLGTTSKLWDFAQRLLPESGRRALVRYMTSS